MIKKVLLWIWTNRKTPKVQCLLSGVIGAFLCFALFCSNQKLLIEMLELWKDRSQVPTIQVDGDLIVNRGLGTRVRVDSPECKEILKLLTARPFEGGQR